MYSHVKTRYRGASGLRHSGRSNRSGGKHSNAVSSDMYVNKTQGTPVEETYEVTHKFKDFSMHPYVLERVEKRGYVTPTPIQDKAIPEIMQGRDVIGIAETGTGKTAAFILPMISKLYLAKYEKVLIIAPTRELAVQINDEFKKFTEGMHMFSAILIGGSSFGNQLKSLQRRPQVIIGTPGRLKDHITRGTLRVSDFKNLILDEADLMVDMGFIKDIRYIISCLPKERQSLFFSATIRPEVQGLINAFMNDPLTISVKKRDTARNVDQDIVRYTDNFHRLTLLGNMLTQEEFKKVLIFGRTKHGVEKLHESLVERGLSSVSIHGNKNQAQRQRALQEFKEDRAQIMVATDVAARGLDIPDVTHVINYEAPENYTDYIHRIGRTGRANKTGRALTFVR